MVNIVSRLYPTLADLSQSLDTIYRVSMFGCACGAALGLLVGYIRIAYLREQEARLIPHVITLAFAGLMTGFVVSLAAFCGQLMS